MRDRPSWDETWMSMAKLLASRSYDPKYKVGCVVVTRDNLQVLGVGYNGNFRGGPNARDSNEQFKSGMIHAEANALIKARFDPYELKTLYCTHAPCVNCAKLIIQSHIFEVVYSMGYEPNGIELLKSNGVEVRRFGDADNP